MDAGEDGGSSAASAAKRPRGEDAAKHDVETGGTVAGGEPASSGVSEPLPPPVLSIGVLPSPPE